MSNKFYQIDSNVPDLFKFFYSYLDYENELIEGRPEFFHEINANHDHLLLCKCFLVYTTDLENSKNFELGEIQKEFPLGLGCQTCIPKAVEILSRKKKNLTGQETLKKLPLEVSAHSLAKLIKNQSLEDQFQVLGENQDEVLVKVLITNVKSNPRDDFFNTFNHIEFLGKKIKIK